MSEYHCVLCASQDTDHIFRDDNRMNFVRDYYHCNICSLIFVPPVQRLTPEEEFQRYELHENDPEDPNYRKFLNRMSKPILERIHPGSYGLDFGSGPGPTLNMMLEKKGHTVEVFDIYYANDPSVFKNKYDFITTTETVEHLFRPWDELNRLWSSLKEGGWLGIMTKRSEGIQEFKNWYYKNDDTHVIFFSDDTFRWIGKQWGATPEFISDDVVLFQKPSD